MPTCFWTNDEGCWEPGCGHDPTTPIYNFGFYVRTGTYVPKGNVGSTSLLSFGSFAHATLTSVKLYAPAVAGGCNCGLVNWVDCLTPTTPNYGTCTGTETASSPPIGSLLASASGLSHSFDPTSTSAFDAMVLYARDAVTISTDYDNIIVVSIQTDIGILVFPFGYECCY
jgi:hypothetical protein